jgi:hypothetical protein
MENNIRIVRFKDSLDVVCYLKEKEDYTYDISDPMMFEIRNSNLLMQHWLPVGMLKNSTVNIKIEDTLCIMEPDSEFATYYANTIEKLRDMNKSKPKDKDSEKEYMLDILDALDELDSSKNIKLH